MGEKRKPHFTFLLKKPGMKSVKVELFQSQLLEGKALSKDSYGRISDRRYRVRSAGKWFSYDDYKYTFLTRYEIRDLIWRSTDWLF